MNQKLLTTVAFLNESSVVVKANAIISTGMRHMIPTMTSRNKNYLFTALVTTVIVMGIPRLSYAQQEDGPDYSGICQTLQPVLIESCDRLVNDDGSLTPDGTHAMHCIRNGILLGTGASLLGLPLPLVLKGLSILSAPAGCDGIIDMSGFNLLGNVGSLSSLLSSLP